VCLPTYELINNHYILDELFLLKKLAVVNDIRKLPRSVHGGIHAINDLRNALAHSFFLENRRQYMVHRRVLYKSADIFSLAGMQLLEEDANMINNYLFRRAFH
jgi:hypothetical protein